MKYVCKKVIIPERYTYITAFLTMRCNLNCSFCLNGFHRNFNRNGFTEISGKQWVKALNRIVSRPEVPITFTGGEPLLHEDFIYIINYLKPELNIDILTNLYWSKRDLERFIKEVKPERLSRDAPYASIRISYYPEQMGNGAKLVENSKKLHDAGFSICIYSILYPSAEHLSAINQIQFRCRDAGIDFRIKEYLGKYNGKLYGNYSKYPDSVFQEKTKYCLCRTSELLIGIDTNIYRCHNDLYTAENPIGYLIDPEFQIEERFIPCDKYGQCHPCDVKVKTNYKQQLGYTSVEIKDIKVHI